MSQKKFLIYLADDDKDDRMFFKEAIDEIDMGVYIEDFDNGVTLMDYLLQPDRRLPDAIYLDLNMPLMNGEECLIDIRNEPKLSGIPIIIYSTFVDDKLANNLKRKGANWYLMKPSSFGKLKKLVQKSLENIYNETKTSQLDFVITES